MSADLTVPINWFFDDGVIVVEILARDINQPELARSMGDQLYTLMKKGPGSRLVLDFAATKYMSSTAFAVLMELAKRAAAAEAQLRICQMDSFVRVGADILSLGQMIPIDDTRAESIAKLRP